MGAASTQAAIVVERLFCGHDPRVELAEGIEELAIEADLSFAGGDLLGGKQQFLVFEPGFDNLSGAGKCLIVCGGG